VELLDEAAIAFEREANSATDNPLILPDLDGRWTRIVSGGHFHGMPLAIRMHGIQQAFAMIASLCNARCQRYVDRYRNKGLGNVLLWPRLTDDERQVSSGMMIPEYASAALTNVIIGAATPSHLFSISTDSGQEDHVSMGTGLAVRTWETAPRVAEVVAIELAYAAQAAWIRRETSRWPSKRTLSPAQREGLSAQYAQLGNDATRAMGAPFHLQAELHAFFEVQEEERRLSPLCERILELMAGIFPPVTEDRVFSTDLRALANAVLDGSIVAVAEREGVFRRER
jgi:histidine ammonia-lyase